jgi:acyl-CoA synthetase (AMP-forming)/AMP-acid ligase II
MVNLYHSDLLNTLIGIKDGAQEILRKGAGLTIRDLFQKSKQLAIGLHKHGFSENDVVLITLPPGEEFLIVIYAIAMLRGKAALVDPEMGKINFAAKVRQLVPRWAFIDSRLLFLKEHPLLRAFLYRIRKHIPTIPSVPGCTVISTGPWMPVIKRYRRFSSLLSQPGDVQFVTYDKDHEFLIVYTSGTIQEPKGVVHSFRSLGKSIANLVKLIGERKGDKLGTTLPHYMLLGIAADIPVHILRSRTPKNLLHEIGEERITLLFGPPSEYLPLVEYCEQQKRKLPDTLRKVFFGSAPVHHTFLKRFFAVATSHLDAVCLYGMTELLLCATIHGREKLQLKDCRGDMLGKLWEDVECKIQPDGEILLRSPQMYSRYFHERDRGEFHATGDTGYLDENDNLVLTGRKKDMIIRGNYNIYPSIYETIIRNIEGVKDCALVGVWNDKKEDEEVYLVVEGDSLRKEKIKQNLEYGKYAIPREAWPDQIVIMPLPRSGRHAKVDKKKLRLFFTAGS